MYPSDAGEVVLRNDSASSKTVTLKVVAWTPWADEYDEQLDAEDHGPQEISETDASEILAEQPSRPMAADTPPQSVMSSYGLSDGNTVLDTGNDGNLICDVVSGDPQGDYVEKCYEYLTNTSYDAQLDLLVPTKLSGWSAAEGASYSQSTTTELERAAQAAGCLPYPSWLTKRDAACSISGVHVIDRQRIDGVQTITGEAHLRMITTVALNPRRPDIIMSNTLYWDNGYGSGNRVPFESQAYCTNGLPLINGDAGLVTNTSRVDLAVTECHISMTTNQVEYAHMSTTTMFPPDAVHFHLKHAPAVRCDKMSYLPSASGGGCVFYEATPEWKLRSSSYPQSAAHVAYAQSLGMHLGSYARGGPALTRKYFAGANPNRRAARYLCAVNGYSGIPGKDCDEYAMASTGQGCHYMTCYLRPIDASDNRGSGASLGNFYRANRVMNGDRFWVTVV